MERERKRGSQQPLRGSILMRTFSTRPHLSPPSFPTYGSNQSQCNPHAPSPPSLSGQFTKLLLSFSEEGRDLQDQKM